MKRWKTWGVIVLNGMVFNVRYNLREVGIYGNKMLKAILGKEVWRCTID